MFLHNFKYELKMVLRQREFIMWLMLFPIVLGTLFKVAFGSVYSNTDLFQSIPVAVVNTSGDEVYKQMFTALGEGDDATLSITYTDEEEAKELLFAGKVKGIIVNDGGLYLQVSGKGIRQSILQEVVSRCNLYRTVVMQAIADGDIPLMNSVIAELSKDVKACRDVSPTADNPDVYVQYFYNLIAMVAICGSLTGLHVATSSQANQSELGARKNFSPTPKFTHLSAALLGSCVAQGVSMILCVTFLRFVLRINFGGNLLLIYAAAVMSGVLGVTLGFFVGSIGRLKYEIKSAIMLSCSMVLCFLSGLMMGNIKGILAEKAPWINRINPVAIISDSFYCLNMYSDYRRFITKIVAMAIYIGVFTVLGVLLSRRKKYASL
ncbi:MAG: ABC transporter permease [Lachnospiraceae bacterium]|nr:ABC transporter permease [Lachnospiraceae bacterium]